MKDQNEKAGKPKALLKAARRKAAQGDTEAACELFQSCMQGYLRERMPWNAIAAAKIARISLGGHPRAQGMLIGLLSSLGLAGDARKESSEGSAAWMKDNVSLFRDLSMNELASFLEIMQVGLVRKGRYAVRRGEAGSDVYIVLKGSLEVIRDGETVGVMIPGDVFGELGFFSGGPRSADVRARESSELVRIPFGPLKKLCARSLNLKHALDKLYHERILKKAGEDLRGNPMVDLERDAVATVRFAKGSSIPFDSSTEVTIVKHGIVEITCGRPGLPEKRYIKPGNVIGRVEGTVRAGTDVELIRARSGIPGPGKKAGGI
jgi:CRP-like cAMP-binding protein